MPDAENDRIIIKIQQGDEKMTKEEARQQISALSSATVKGSSGSEQDGRGFLLTALADLWNINGTRNDHGASRRRITGRYRNDDVTFEQIHKVICQYPDGIPGDTPNFDDLVLGSRPVSKPQTQRFGSERNRPVSKPQTEYSGFERNQPVSKPQTQYSGQYSGFERRQPVSSGSGMSVAMSVVVFVIAMLVCRLGFHWGWIVSVIVSLVAGVLLEDFYSTKADMRAYGSGRNNGKAERRRKGSSEAKMTKENRSDVVAAALTGWLPWGLAVYWMFGGSLSAGASSIIGIIVSVLLYRRSRWSAGGTLVLLPLLLCAFFYMIR